MIDIGKRRRTTETQKPENSSLVTYFTVCFRIVRRARHTSTRASVYCVILRATDKRTGRTGGREQLAERTTTTRRGTITTAMMSRTAVHETSIRGSSSSAKKMRNAVAVARGRGLALQRSLFSSITVVDSRLLPTMMTTTTTIPARTTCRSLHGDGRSACEVRPVIIVLAFTLTLRVRARHVARPRYISRVVRNENSNQLIWLWQRISGAGKRDRVAIGRDTSAARSLLAIARLDGRADGSMIILLRRAGIAHNFE